MTPVARFLELLAREAPAAEFEEPVAAARAAGATAGQLAALERDKLVALRVRALLAHRRWPPAPATPGPPPRCAGAERRRA